ncbi:MAG: hypothetical protein CENE_00933 [Candidatus Celerinatantimonas neptuna]|nr:MAG: hypothetical protein CENE_00933 [Candidatus Celerinatantimonas neptuna]
MATVRCPIFMYHQITHENHPSFNNHLSVTVKRFEEQIYYLTKKNYQFITLRELATNPNLDFCRNKYIILTFDDIFQTFYQFAFPILKKYGIRATAFLIGNSFNHDKYMNLKEDGLISLTSDQINELLEYGIEIGSHTMTHNQLTDLTDNQANQELTDSYQLIKSLTNDNITFCYPRGAYNTEHLKMVKEIGYLAAVTIQRGNAQDLSALFNLKRIKVSQKHKGIKIRYLCSFLYDLNYRLKAKKDNK